MVETTLRISILFVHTVTHIGHIKILSKTGGSFTLVLIAAVLSLMAMILAFIYVSRNSSKVAYILIGFVLIASAIEVILQKITKRTIKQRVV